MKKLIALLLVGSLCIVGCNEQRRYHRGPPRFDGPPPRGVPMHPGPRNGPPMMFPMRPGPGNGPMGPREGQPPRVAPTHPGPVVPPADVRPNK